MKTQQNNGGTLLAEQKWAAYRLADDPQTYGKNAGKYIITTDDFEEEIFDGRVFEEEDAERLVNAHNGAIDMFAQADGVR